MKIKTKIKSNYFENSIISMNYISKKKLYGFDAGEKHTFIEIKFKNESAMRKVKNLWYSSTTSKTGEYTRGLIKEGYICKEDSTSTFIYEAQIPPLLRMFHIKNISPSGWIALPTNKASKIQSRNGKTSLQF